jgi:apolipoprotein N-acyltransferase
MNHHSGRLRWLLLLVGCTLIPFVAWQNAIPVAAWLAPVFLLRFGRSSKQFTGHLIFLAYLVGIVLATRVALTNNSQLKILWFLLVPVFRGFMYSLPYWADHFISSRLGKWGRLFIFPLGFTTVEWVMSLLRVINTSGSFVYSQYDNLALMQLASITGMWGVAFLIAWFASIANLLWEYRFAWRLARREVVSFAVVLLVVLILGNFRIISELDFTHG